LVPGVILIKKGQVLNLFVLEGKPKRASSGRGKSSDSEGKPAALERSDSNVLDSDDALFIDMARAG
jgi:hypothetical protein